MKTIILAGRCFCGVEEFMSRIPGVIETEVAYVNGRTKNPTYKEIYYGNTYFAEGCKVVYYEKILSLENLLKEFWSIINPISLNKQWNNVGSQYRTGIYYTFSEDLEIINLSLKEEQEKVFKKKQNYINLKI